MNQPVGNVRLGDSVERRDGSIGVVRAIAWIDEAVYIYFRVGGAERYESTETILVLEDERVVPHA